MNALLTRLSYAAGSPGRRVLQNCLYMTGTMLVLGLLLCAGSAWAASNSDACTRKVEGLLSQMTIEEKVGQMTQIDMNGLRDKAHLQQYAIGSMLSGGDSDPKDNLPQTWLQACREYQDWALKSRLKIPLIYGVDAVHGHNNIDGAVVFPHNIGLGATRNPALVERAGKVTAMEVAGTGIHWAFAPCVAAVQNIHWGRTYESFSESPELAGQLGEAAVKGLQSKLPNGFAVLACPKHFLADGGTQDGIDQGNAVCDEAFLRKVHLAPYLPSIKAGADSIMVSYSSWQGQKMHGNKHLLTDVLKGELGFQGFLISDYAAIDQLGGDYKHDIEVSINAGLDMIMIPNGPGQKNNYVDFITGLKQLVAEGKVPQARVDDAVRRILGAKVRMGVFENPYGDPKLLADVGSAAHRKVARECVRESLVLLKNENRALPLSKKMKKLVVAGSVADDLGAQCGGWTVTWQGKPGEVMRGGTTILKGIQKAAAPNTQVVFSPDAKDLQGADAIVVVVGEMPYAEMKGDNADLRLPAKDVELIQRARQAGVPVVTVLVSGRPLVLGKALDASNALVAAWLPGTEGDGVADVLFGEAKPVGKLPRTWPRDNSQLGGTINQPSAEPPQFAFGFGLTYDVAP